MHPGACGCPLHVGGLFNVALSPSLPVRAHLFPAVQVLGTIRHISLRALPEMSAQALAWADLSSFTSFVALDCLLPGPQEWHAFIKLFARTIALPILLLAASALMWTLCWLFRHWAVRLHRKYGHRQALRLRWQPLRSMQRRVASAPDPLREYLNPRMLITGVVLAYSLYPLVTSGLLYTLQCVYIPGPFAVESATVEYSRRHYDWLLQRASAVAVAANASSSDAAASAAAAGGAGAAGDIQLCRPGQGALESGLCWVTGRFWAMDYDVQVGGVLKTVYGCRCRFCCMMSCLPRQLRNKSACCFMSSRSCWSTAACVSRACSRGTVRCVCRSTRCAAAGWCLVLSCSALRGTTEQ